MSDPGHDDPELAGLEPDEDADQGAAPDAAVFDQVRRALAGPADLSLAEVADRAGLPTQILREILEATGWHDRAGYDERDVAYARAIGQMLDVYPIGALVRGLRTRYRALTSVVIGDLGTVRDHVVTPALARGADPTELAERLGRAAEHTVPLVTSQLAEDYRRVLLQLLDSDAVVRGVQVGDGRDIELAVAFVDIVGYTALSGRIDPTGLDHVLASFEDLITEAAARTDGVLLAKFVGDAAMLVSPDLVTLTTLMLDLVSDEQRLAEAPRRAGIACGSVLVREGDYYGPIPNLAARLTDHAHAWSLLAAEELEDQLADHVAVERISKIRIHGVGERRPLRVRRAGADG